LSFINYIDRLSRNDPLYEYLRYDIRSQLGVNGDPLASGCIAFPHPTTSTSTKIGGAGLALSESFSTASRTAHRRLPFAAWSGNSTTCIMLDELRRAYHMALVSGAQPCYALPEMKAAGLEGIFDPIIISASYAFRKPDTRLNGRPSTS
jgi:hypothetical protein